jgi:hypothetical protein
MDLGRDYHLHESYLCYLDTQNFVLKPGLASFPLWKGLAAKIGLKMEAGYIVCCVCVMDDWDDESFCLHDAKSLLL